MPKQLSTRCLSPSSRYNHLQLLYIVGGGGAGHWTRCIHAEVQEIQLARAPPNTISLSSLYITVQHTLPPNTTTTQSTPHKSIPHDTYSTTTLAEHRSAQRIAAHTNTRACITYTHTQARHYENSFTRMKIRIRACLISFTSFFQQ